MDILVDYENLHYKGLFGTKFLNAGDNLEIYYSDSCRKIPSYYMDDIVNSGCKFDIIPILKKRKNAADFYIVSRAAEILSTDEESNVLIVSGDMGFRAALDYWQRKLNPANRLMLKENIAEGIISSAEPQGRKQQIQDYIAVYPLEQCKQKCEDRDRRTQIIDGIHDRYMNTEFESCIPQIISIMDYSSQKKDMYLGCMKEFGKDKGLEVYRHMKELV